jgi:hypothetical protein
MSWYKGDMVGERAAHPDVPVGAHGTSVKHAVGIWNDKCIKGRPLKFNRSQIGVFFTPFGPTDRGPLRQYLRLPSEQRCKLYGLEVGKGDAVILFRVNLDDDLLVMPRELKGGGDEAAMKGDVSLAFQSRLAAKGAPRQAQRYNPNIAEDISWTVTELVQAFYP